MPSTNKPKAVFDSSRTASYHIKNIVEISQSHMMSNSFKLILNHAGGKKRYDFEAESAKQAGEFLFLSSFWIESSLCWICADSHRFAADIVQTIRSLKTAIDRSSTLKSRRSRHVA